MNEKMDRKNKIFLKWRSHEIKHSVIDLNICKYKEEKLQKIFFFYAEKVN